VYRAPGFERPPLPAANVPDRSRPAEGATVPAIVARGADGRMQTVAYDSERRPTVLYVFSDECVWCNRNYENLTALVREKQASYRFIGLAMSPPADPQRASVVPEGMLMLYDIDPKTREAYGLGPTPHTIVVSPEGRVVKSWRGAYARQTATDIERFFSVDLPGLSEE
jgi:hypothetical protein